MEMKKGLSSELITILDDVESVLGELRSLGAPEGLSELLDSAKASLSGGRLRVAVVGTVKAGKSTLTNCLLGDDHLKRGAGVVTAFITRMAAGKKPRAVIRFKTLKEANEELKRAISALPGGEELKGKVNLADDSFRQKARGFLEGLNREVLIRDGRFDPSFLHALNLVEGYPGIAPYLKGKSLELKGKKVREHRDLVGNETSAVFLEDVALFLPSPWLEEGIELSDCQGADSPNPHHLARLQAHLLNCNFIIYLVGSRSGLREADLALIETLKGLGLAHSAFFVLNLDLDDYPDAGEAEQAVERFKEELARIIDTERAYSFSCLLELIRTLEDKGGLTPRDQRRLADWEAAGLDTVSDRGFGLFEEHLKRELTLRKNRLLLGQAAKRAQLVVGNMGTWSASALRLAEKDLGEVSEVEEALARLKRAQASALESLMRGLEGVKESLKKELAREVDDLFYPGNPLVKETLQFIDSYTPEENFVRQGEEKGDRPLPIEIYRMFRSFREAMQKALVERVNVTVASFARKKSAHALLSLNQSVESLWTVFLEGLRSYREPLASLGVEAADPGLYEKPPDVAVPEITMPLLSEVVDLEGVDIGKVAVRIGSGGFKQLALKLWARARGKTATLERPEEVGLRLAKEDAKKELRRAFLDFRENIKFAYLYRILEEAGDSAAGDLKVRANLVISQVESLTESLKGSGLGTRELLGDLRRLKGEVDRLQGRLGEISQSMENDTYQDAVEA